MFRFALALCVLSSSLNAAEIKCSTSIAAPEKGDPRARAAAQRGLDFMSRFSKQWSAQNPQC